jgi:hypothetical protein
LNPEKQRKGATSFQQIPGFDPEGGGDAVKRGNRHVAVAGAFNVIPSLSIGEAREMSRSFLRELEREA